MVAMWQKTKWVLVHANSIKHKIILSNPTLLFEWIFHNFAFIISKGERDSKKWLYADWLSD